MPAPRRLLLVAAEATPRSPIRRYRIGRLISEPPTPEQLIRTTTSALAVDERARVRI